MDENIEDTKKFTEFFFKNLGCITLWKENVLIVENVPENFAKFYGKKEPYHLGFESGDSADLTEVIVKGSYLLKTIASWLESRGQTSIIKIDFDIPEEEIRKWFKFENCEIHSIKKNVENKYFFRFNFQTSFQYLSEKEQIITPIYVEDGKPISFNIEGYRMVEGRKQDVDVEDIRNSYDVAKKELKEVINKKMIEVSQVLEKKLEKEIKRIQEHYLKLKNEKMEGVQRIELQIAELEKNADKNREKIEKVKENLIVSRNSLDLEKLKKEEEFFISDETRKHSLNIDKKIINTSIVYYPIFHLTIFLKNNDSGRQIEIVYNPLKEEKGEVMCDVCNKEIKEIVMDSSGHITCKDCFGKCHECGKISCHNCLSECEYCKKLICRKCAGRCLKCGKHLCKSHLKKNNKCVNCLKICSGCRDYFEESDMVKCSCGREMCKNCAKISITMAGGRKVCDHCSRKCSFCEQSYSLNDFKRCSSCTSESCNYPGKCFSCRKQLCARMKK